MYVAIDSSTDFASLALVQDDQVVGEISWRCGRNHTQQLLPSLSLVLERAGLELKSAQGIIVARGPGSYNGLRVGLSTAKALAFSLGVPLVGVSTLEAEAYQHADRGLPVCPILNAGRGEVAAAVFGKQGDEWTRVLAEHVTTLEALAAQTTGQTLFCGEYVATVAPELIERLGNKAIIASPASRLRRAGYLAELGLRRLKASDHDDPTTLQPLYLRGPAITQPKNPW